MSVEAVETLFTADSKRGIGVEDTSLVAEAPLRLFIVTEIAAQAS